MCPPLQNLFPHLPAQFQPLGANGLDHHNRFLLAALGAAKSARSSVVAQKSLNTEVIAASTSVEVNTASLPGFHATEISAGPARRIIAPPAVEPKAARRKIVVPPGAYLRAIADFFCSRATVVLVFEPLLADEQADRLRR